LSRKVQLSASGYRAWWAAYEEGGIREDHPPTEELTDLVASAGKILVSSRRRALESAVAAGADEKSLEGDALFIEAPLPPPPFPEGFKARPPAWGVIARTAWWLGYGEGGETRAEAEKRAEIAADRLVAESDLHGEVVLFAHGYFNHMIGRALVRKGWRLVRNQGFRYWAVRRFEPR
jgi:broad specificity phosphatase PhoE